MSEADILDEALVVQAETQIIPGVFTSGSVMRHVLVMALTSGIGLMAIFLVDVLSLLYVSRLGSEVKIAAVGFASTILFLAISSSIGFMIAISALVSRCIGAGDDVAARRMAASGIVWTAIVSAAIAFILFLAKDTILTLLNAKGEAFTIASAYLDFTLPSNILMAVGVAYSGILRAAGDAKRAMYVTLGGGIATAFIDPLMIFVLHFDVMGAAYSTVIARLIFCLIGYHGAVMKLDLVARPRMKDAMQDLKPLMTIAVPAILTNLASPVGSAFLASTVAKFGDSAVAAGAVIDRVTPLAFGGMFALSGAIGPVLGQNWGAGLFERMRRTLRDAYVIGLIYVLLTWVLLVLASGVIARIFDLNSEAAHIVRIYCLASGVGWLGLGALFVANASFNNLGAPMRATLFNWGRATLGTIPFAAWGAAHYGPLGAIIGVMAAAALFGAVASVSAFAVLNKVVRRKLPQFRRA